MKQIEIDQRIAMHEKAIRTLEVLKDAKRRIAVIHDNKRHLQWWQDAAKLYDHDIEILNMCLVRLGQRYAKIVNNLKPE